jgi:hypothetical protein
MNSSLDVVERPVELTNRRRAKKPIAAKISLKMTASSRLKGHCSLKGMTSGVVVGAVVNFCITDTKGKSVFADAKVAGDGFYCLRVNLGALESGQINVLASTTSLDCSSLEVEVEAGIDKLGQFQPNRGGFGLSLFKAGASLLG